MKGVVFRSLEVFVENRFGEEMVDKAWGLPTLSTEGAYTSIGNYPYTDFLSLILFVAKESEVDVHQLVREFGEALFMILADAHADLINKFKSPIELLSVIETVIHRDVRKIYTNTELPKFDVLERKGSSFLHLEYSSSRPFANLAEGLILGCLSYYDVKEISCIEREDIETNGTHSRFKISVRENATEQENR